MKSYLECWTTVATALLSQALAGEPELAESLPKSLAAGAFGFAATITGDVEGRFAVVLDPSILESPLVGEGVDQKAGWSEILKEVADAAAGEFLAQTGKKCHVVAFEEIAEESKVSCAFQLKSGENVWTILVRDEVRIPKPAAQPPVSPEAQPSVQPETQRSAPPAAAPFVAAPASTAPPASDFSPAQVPLPALSAGVELLLDIELEAALRFGCKELPLGEILDLGPGDVVQLDRNVADPVDLIVGDKIVARGEVVLVNGNFGLRITEVAAPRKRLESIRCLF
jgi:flagellar motor switch protein FliN/FliY